MQKGKQMADLIDRVKAIRDVKEYADKHASNHHYKGMKRACKVLLTVPSAEPKQQWIPCSERLPDKEGQYLVTGDAGGVVSIICDVFFHYDDGAPTWLLSQNVKAWMELPEAYREGEG